MVERKPRGVAPRITASQSFNEDEIKVLDGIFSTLLRGGDPKILMRSPAAKNVMRKVQTMKASIERQKSITHTTRTTTPAQCTCEDAYAECFDANPTGHYVGCPLWGTTHPNKHMPRGLTLPGAERFIPGHDDDSGGFVQ